MIATDTPAADLPGAVLDLRSTVAPYPGLADTLEGNHVLMWPLAAICPDRGTPVEAVFPADVRPRDVAALVRPEVASTDITAWFTPRLALPALDDIDPATLPTSPGSRVLLDQTETPTAARQTMSDLATRLGNGWRAKEKVVERTSLYWVIDRHRRCGIRRVVSALTIGRSHVRPEGPGADQIFRRWRTESSTTLVALPDGRWLLTSGVRFTPQQRGLKFIAECLFAESVDFDVREDGRTTTSGALAGLPDEALRLLPAPVRAREVSPLLERYDFLGFDDGTAFDSPRVRDNLRAFPSGTVSAFRGASTAAALTANLYGARNHRRDLVKEVARATVRDLAFTRQFRGLVPVDWIVDALRSIRENREAPEPAEASQQRQRHAGRLGIGDRRQREPDVRALLRRLATIDQRALRHLLCDYGQTGEHLYRRLVADSLRMTGLLDDATVERALRGARIRTWRDLHEALLQVLLVFGETSKRKTPRRPIDLPDEVAAIEGPISAPVPGPEAAPAGTIHVRIARHETQLWAWGVQMSHCIGTYADQLRSGASALGAVYVVEGGVEGGVERLIGNFQISRYGQERHLVQLLGKANSALPPAQARSVAAHLGSHGVVVDQYLGRPGDEDHLRRLHAQAA